MDDLQQLIDSRINEVLPNYLKGGAFTDRKVTDTPTDNLQVVNKKYCDANSVSIYGNLYLSGTQTVGVTAPIYEKVLLDNNSFSSGLTIDLTNHRIIILTAGIYQVSASVQYDAATSGNVCAGAIYVNGSIVANNWAHASRNNGNISCSIADILSLSVNDHVELYTTKEFANGLLDSGSPYTFLSIGKL